MGVRGQKQEKSYRNIWSSSDSWRERDGWELLNDGSVLSYTPSWSFLYAVFSDPIACLILRTALWGWIPVVCMGHLYRETIRKIQLWGHQGSAQGQRRDQRPCCQLAVVCSTACPWGYSSLSRSSVSTLIPPQTSWEYWDKHIGPEGEHGWENGKGGRKGERRGGRRAEGIV